MSAQAAWNEAIRMLCCEQVGTCGTHARDDTCRLATNWTHRTSRIETKDVQDVSKIEADGLNIDHRLRQDKSSIVGEARSYWESTSFQFFSRWDTDSASKIGRSCRYGGSAKD